LLLTIFGVDSMIASVSTGKPKVRSKPKNLNLRPARGGKGVIIPPNRLGDLRLPVDPATLATKNVVVVFTAGGTSVGLVEPSFHIPIESDLSDLELLGRARGIVQRTLRKSKASERKEIELALLELLARTLGDENLNPTSNFSTEISLLTRYLKNTEESYDLISTGISTVDGEDKFKEYSMKTLENQNSAIFAHIERIMRGDKISSLEDHLLNYSVPHHFFRKTGETKLTKEFVNNCRKIFFPSNLSSTFTISLRECLNDNFIKENKDILEKTPTIGILRQKNFLDTWSDEPYKSFREGEAKHNRFYRSAIYIIPNWISLKQFLFQKKVSGKIPRNDMLPILSVINDTMVSIVFGRFDKTLNYNDYWKIVTGLTEIPPESVKEDTRERLSKTLKSKDIPLDKMFPESEHFKKLFQEFLPSKFSTKIIPIKFSITELKIEEKKLLKQKFLMKDLKPLEIKAKENFSKHKGKLPHWFQANVEKKASRGALKTQLSKESLKILAELISVDRRYAPALGRMKSFLRSFSSVAMQNAAARILLNSREEVVVLRKPQEYEQPDGLSEEERLVLETPEEDEDLGNED